jgi:predicted RNA-binding Zn-ribbon protein involved in translation (DUF1610 family)
MDKKTEEAIQRLEKIIDLGHSFTFIANHDIMKQDFKKIKEKLEYLDRMCETLLEDAKEIETPMNTIIIPKGNGHYEHECPSCGLSIGYTNEVRYNHPFEYCPGCGKRVIYTDVKEGK